MRLTTFALACAALASQSACSFGGGAMPAGAQERVAAAHMRHETVPVLGGCQMFPQDNPWNTDISQAPVDPNSGNYMAHMNAGSTYLHPDFGSNPTYGIPVTLAPKNTPYVPIKFTLYGDQSDKGPYPIPKNARIEGGKHSNGDRHVLVVGEKDCHLYEMWRSFYVGPGWKAGSGAKFDLSSDKLRPDCWTSADAAGLPITAALPKYDEVQNGEIDHAMRFTVQTTQAAFVHPATHYASSSHDPNDPPMGLRVRLKASYDISGFTGESYVILVALKKYGMFLADNGSDWFITGATDSRWNDQDLDQLKTVPASEFEVVQLGQIYTNC